MEIIDARKKVCPQPVIMTKQKVDEGLTEITVIVDNDTAKSNVTKFGNKLNFKTSFEENDDGIYIYLKKPENNNQEKTTETTIQKENVEIKQSRGYVFTTDKLGNGNDELGKILMKGFIYALSEKKPYPEFLIFLNSGVKLTVEGSDSLDDLKKFEGANVKIVSCGTCLDFFGVKDKLCVGAISNMYDIVETISDSTNTITI